MPIGILIFLQSWLSSQLFLRYIQIHKYKVTDASAHHEQMKNFVRTEMFMLGIKDWQLQGIYNAAYRVDDTACKKPQEGAAGQCIPQSADNREAYPSHSDIYYRREPLRTRDPASFGDHACDCNAPDDSK